jgi:hypothetical protein
MFIIQSKRESKLFGEGSVESFTDTQKLGRFGVCIFPTIEMAEEVLKYIIDYHGGESGQEFYIKEVTDDYFYQIFLDMPENKHLKRNYKIDQIN